MKKIPILIAALLLPALNGLLLSGQSPIAELTPVLNLGLSLLVLLPTLLPEGEIPKSHSKIELLLKSWEIGDGIPVWMPTASGPPARGAALTSIHISIPEGDIHRSRGQGAFKPRRPRFSYNG